MGSLVHHLARDLGRLGGVLLLLPGPLRSRTPVEDREHAGREDLVRVRALCLGEGLVETTIGTWDVAIPEPRGLQPVNRSVADAEATATDGG